jgi:hypothetical protein
MGAEADGKITPRSAAPYLPPALHGVLANELRHEILMRCGERPWSATELAEALEQPRRRITDQIEELKKLDPPLLECVGKKPSPKGGSMFMYKAARFIFNTEEWDQLSPVEQAVSSANIVKLVTEELARGIRDGTLYNTSDHYLLRDRQMVDRQAMAEIRELLDEAHDRFVGIATTATQRLESSGERPIPITLALVSGEVAPKGR